MGRYTILAIDGGGIRGIIPARVLQEIERRLGGPRIAEVFDLVAGTSTGGLIALGLTKAGAGGRPQYAAADMLALYQDDGERIFPSSIVLKVETLGGLADVRYPARPLEELLAERFGEAMLSDALAEVVVPSYDLTKPGPFFFKREYARDEAHTWDVPIATAARATSAAPTYFDPARLPPFEHEGEHALVDGGTFANNPTLAAVVDGMRLKPEHDELLIVSLGTGHPPTVPGRGPIPVAADEAEGWGMVRWARPILEVVLDGAARAVEYQMDRLVDQTTLPLSYYRFDTTLSFASPALDDASPGNRAKLLEDADALIEHEATRLAELCAELTA